MQTLRMLAILVAGLPALTLTSVRAADPPPAQPADLFDFWIGDWDLSWTKADGTKATGRNRISRILSGAVIEEKFEGTASAGQPALNGLSHSVLHKGSNTWKQTWVDSSGSYITLTAIVDGDKRIFQTEPVKRNGKEIIQRMVFFNIKKDSLNWDWESTTDGGKTWTKAWQIEYRRRV